MSTNTKQAIENQTTPTEIRSASPTPQQTFAPTPDQTNYKRGYQAGLKYGKLIGRHPESGGLGIEEAIAQDARGSAIRGDGTREDAEWQQGWIDGYKKGFFSIRDAGRKKEEFENLSWSNAFPNVKVYNTDGRHEVTIIATDPVSDLITVRYVHDGTIEDKRLSALSGVWFVRKNPKLSHAN